MQIWTVNRPSTSLKGPVTVPQKEQCGPYSAPPMLEQVFEGRQQVPSWQETHSSDAFVGWSVGGHAT
jgi:hypothetical protein